MKLNSYVKVIFVDIFALIVSLVSNFYIPKVFSIQEYADYRTFSLYISFVGILHLGFSDGIYIKLGGLKQTEVNKKMFKNYTYRFIKLISIISIIIIIIAATIVKGLSFIYFAIYVLPYQVVLYFQLYYRAIGEFNKYFYIQAIINILNLITIIVVLFFLPTKNVNLLIQGQISIYYFVAVTVLLLFIVRYKSIGNDYILEHKELFNIFKMGIQVMIANTISILLLSLDRWIIKINFSSETFAYYSFAVSILSLFLVLVNSFAVILYPYIARTKQDKDKYLNLKRYVLILTSLIPAIYFLIKLVLRHFLPEYLPSKDYVAILLLATPYISMINIVYANVYKTNQKTREYLTITIKSLLISIIINILTLLVFHHPIAIVIANLFAFIIWYIYCAANSNKSLSIQRNEIIFLIINPLSIIIINSLSFNEIISFFWSILFIMINSVILYRVESFSILNQVHITYKKIRNT